MKKFVTAILSLFVLFSVTAYSQNNKCLEEEFAPAIDSLNSYLKQLAVSAPMRISSATVTKKSFNIRLRGTIGDYPLREKNVEDIYSIFKGLMPAKYRQHSGKMKIYSRKEPIESFITNYFRSERDNKYQEEHHKLVGRHHEKMIAPLVTDNSKVVEIKNGLQNRHIALWQSHGFYYEPKLKRWEWQRARIFQTVEDLYTQSYVLPFLVPMLENAGANVLLPRERDWQKNEVIVDNDNPASGYSESGKWSDTNESGFAHTKSFYVQNENPFKMGTARSSSSMASATYTPDIPETGEYAVYVSYQSVKNSNAKAHYEVWYKGGMKSFSVNQNMGGGTWIYLGKFLFEKGKNANQGVVVTNNGESNKVVTTTDAVKFGGGMGNIARRPAEIDPDGKPIEVDFSVEPEISGYPRFTEGARYWLQWAGFNDTIYSINRDMTDYNDDYQSRGQWVNILSDGSYLKPDKEGYNIPLDLSFAFHTDAGTTLNDSIVGTLAIYTKNSNGKEEYPHGEDRTIARDFTDVVQSQIVSDIRATFEPQWQRRALWDRSYSESRAPEVPGMLLELLSHQNFADMRYGLDPTFRFCVSRAIYKGMLKYLAYLNDFEYVVAPLPVNTFSAQVIHGEDGKYYASLRWLEQKDPLEPTATAESYVVYTRENDNSFDNGKVVKGERANIVIEPGKVYSFKVTAVNKGGESFPSETLSVGVASKGDNMGLTKEKTVLIVNNFDRISAPSSFATKDTSRAGFQDYIDSGVPYLQDISYIGPQHEYRREIPWMDDDAPGFGASYSNYETEVVAGNTFDYPYIHGLALLNAGYNFDSSSRDAVILGHAEMTEYPIVDIICGKQITTMVGREGAGELRYRVFPEVFQKIITTFTQKGGSLLVSGSNIATDIWDKVYDFEIDSTMNAVVVEPSKAFASNILKYKWMTNYASSKGIVKGVQNPLGIPAASPTSTNEFYTFNTQPNSKKYAVDSPDALVPTDPKAFTVYRYADNNISAGVAYRGDTYRVVSLGFPIEALQTQDQINRLLADLMRFFEAE